MHGPGAFEAYIDDFNYERIPTAVCLSPSNLDSANVETNSVDLSWTDNASATSWEVSFGLKGFTAGSGTQLIVTSISFSLAGLSSYTDYDWYVRAICAAGDTSMWSDTASFSTLCASPTGVFASNLTRTTADLSWIENNATAATSWELKYQLAGSNNTLGTTIALTNLLFNLQGLNSDTDYDLCVRAICAAGDTSLCSDTLSFTTLACDAPSNVLSSNIGAGSADLNWTENGTSGQWVVSFGPPNFTRRKWDTTCYKF